MSNLIKIDFATGQDIDDILALQTQIYRAEKLATDAKKALEKQLADQSCDVLVVKADNLIVGTATIYYIQVAVRARPYAFLEGLVVDENQRGHGIGTSLFEKCIEIAKRKNCYKMIFTSGTDRTDAHKFYEKLGFRQWGVEFRKDL